MKFNDRSMALLGVPDLPTEAFKHAGDRRIKPQGGGGGGPNTTYSQTSNIPDYAQPYVEQMLGAAQEQIFNYETEPDRYEDVPVYGPDRFGKQVQIGTERKLIPGSKKVPTTMKPFKAFGGTYDERKTITTPDGEIPNPNYGKQTAYDPNAYFAGFQPMQTDAQQGVRDMTLPGEYGQATGATRQSMQNLQNANYKPGQFSMREVQAPTLRQYQMGPAERVSASTFLQPGVAGQYMNPYMQSVVDIQQAAAQRQADIARTGRGAQAAQAGAFGGSRQAIMEAEAARALADQQSAIQAQGLQSAYGQAQQQFNAEQNARMQAALANQGAGLTVGQQNLGALLGIQQLGAGQNLQSQLANQATDQQVQQMIEQSRQFGANYALQAQQAALAAANQLADIGGRGLTAQQGIYNLQNQYGGQQQAFEQSKLNQQIQDYATAQQYPMMQLGNMSALTRGLPMQSSTTSMYQAPPSAVSQLAGLGTAAYGLSQLGGMGGTPTGKAAGGQIKEKRPAGLAELALMKMQ